MCESLYEIGDRVNDLNLVVELFLLCDVDIDGDGDDDGIDDNEGDVAGFGESNRHFAALGFSFASRTIEAVALGFDGVFSF